MQWYFQKWSFNNLSANRNLPHLHDYTCPLKNYYPFAASPLPPGWCSVGCSIPLNLRQIIPCLIANLCLEGYFLDFHYAIYLPNQQRIPRIIVILAASTAKKKEVQKWKTGVRFWWTKMCFNIQSAVHHLLFCWAPQFVCQPHEGRLEKFPHLQAAST